MSDIEKKLDKIDNKLDVIDSKIDAHLERIAKTERDVSWISGHLKVATGFIITFIGAAITWALQLKS